MKISAKTVRMHDLADCTGLTALPQGLTVEGSLDLTDCTGLTALPQGLTVEGSLNLFAAGFFRFNNH